MTQGIHHITAISSDPQTTFQFYSEKLGLRMVKQTVNFDAPDTYHLYFADKKGSPGTVLTFFPFLDAGTGMRGTGQATKVQFAVPRKQLSTWLDKLQDEGIKNKGVEEQFGNKVIRFFDPDGLQLELVFTDEASEALETLVFYGAELSVRDAKTTEAVLVNLLGYDKLGEEGYVTRYINKAGTVAKYIDLFHMPGWPKGVSGAGIVHHVAFRVKDDTEEQALREKVLAAGLLPTGVIDRNYFHSVYFREPNEVLFEIATDEPGFAIDETVEELGSKLQIPPIHKDKRIDILRRLPVFAPHSEASSRESNELANYVHKFVPGKKDVNFLLLHGTGGNETSLVDLADVLNQDFGILALRGNVKEDGMNRFFRRFGPGKLDLQNLETETTKLHEFLLKAATEYKINLDKLILVGISNGANIGLSLILKHPEVIKTAILMHPMLPFPPKLPENSLKEVKILITSGEIDDYLPATERKTLTEALNSAGAEVDFWQHQGGHEIREEEVDKAKKWLNSSL